MADVRVKEGVTVERWDGDRGTRTSVFSRVIGLLNTDATTPGARDQVRHLLLTLWLAVGLSALVVYAMVTFQETLVRLGPWGYLGAFAAELGNSAVIIIPTPGPAYTFAMGVTLNPLSLGLIGGIGATLGELTGYYLGLRGRRVLTGGRLYRWFNGATERWTETILASFAVLPIPFDVAGIWAGTNRYPLWRFIVFVGAGKFVKVTAVALAGYYGIRWFLAPLI
jgi:membrane protein YqaA with SNARE-associated domain